MQADGQGSDGQIVVRAGDPFRRIAFALLVVLVLVNAPALESELRFFNPAAINGADGSAPVLQDSRRSPADDRAFRAAAARLPAGAACVISVEAWNEDYFRAAYIMLPRRVWPYSSDLERRPATPDKLAAALTKHRASCLLLGPRNSPPPRMTRVTTGAYSMYLASTVGQA